MSKIPTSTKKLAAQASSRQLNVNSGTKLKSVENLDQIGRRFLRRRSKSVTDLNVLRNNFKTKPFVPKVPEQIREKTMMNVKTTQKRPAPATNAAKTIVPAKKQKIPSWDYKGRFNQLSEQFSTLQDNYNACEAQLSELRNAEIDLIELKSEKERLLKLCQELQTKNQHYLTKNKHLEEENTVLRDELDKTKNLYEETSETCTEQRKELETLLLKYSTINEDHNKIQKQLAESLNQIRDLKNTLEQHETLRRLMHNQIQDLKGNIRVFCRVRPAVTQCEKERLLCSLHFPNETSLEIHKSRESVSTLKNKFADFRQEFNFDKVFPPQASQEEVFIELSQLVQSAVDGYNVCVFAYGQTGSGKTFTMQGTPTDLGMIPKTVDLIFDTIKKAEKCGWSYEVQASFLEIYNENVKDLLQRNNLTNLEIKYNDGKGITVTNLTTKTVNSANELKHFMYIANENRAVAATDFNEHSSRSHAVTKIYLNGYNGKQHLRYTGSIHLVDLAGSESAKTSANDRLVETKNINKSLSALGSVMMALYNKDPHVPYRNSKLTFLLQSCLGGNSKTLMFVNISPFEECFNESINSLRFAAQVKEVKTVSKRNRIGQ